MLLMASARGGMHHGLHAPEEHNCNKQLAHVHLEHRHVLLRVGEQRVEREGLHSGLHDGRRRGGQRESCLGHHAVLEVGHEVVEGEVGVSVRYGSKVNLEGGINGGKVRGKREWNQEMEVEATLFCAHPVMVMRVSE